MEKMGADDRSLEEFFEEKKRVRNPFVPIVRKLNTDGWSSHDGSGGCGGVIRGNIGEWIRGFTIKLAGKDTIEAELMGLIEGLEICWNLGFKQVIAEIDAKQIVQITEKKQQLAGYNHIQRKLTSLLSRSWNVKLQHVYREGNRCADLLATMSRKQQKQKMVWEIPPEEIVQTMEADMLGKSFVRKVFL